MPEKGRGRVRLRARWIILALIVVALSPRALRGCGDHGQVEERDFLVVVESSLAEPLRASLDRYAEDMQISAIEVHVEPFEPDTVEKLRDLLFQYIDVHGVEGALLIGDLPAAWYEQTAFDYYEQFPIDLYLQDYDAIWTDEDEDGMFDAHSDLHLDIYTARLHGTAEELVDYFERAHAYRWDGRLLDASAFIFIDDDWSNAGADDAFRLSELYSNVEICKERYESTAEAYVAKMTGEGAEFIYQLIHSSPGLLQIEHQSEGGETTYTRIMGHEICDLNFKGSFYNLFNCSAARFTEEGNQGPDYLARDYIVGTDYGLAAVGSTKTGAIARPRIFHGNLVVGQRWGEAYRRWFNTEGYKDDEWHLGVVVIGDPLLRLSGDLVPWALRQLPEATPPGEIEGIEQIMENIAAGAQLGTYEEYREQNPQFFD